MMRPSLVLGSLALAGSVLVAVACSTDRDSFDDHQAPLYVPDGAPPPATCADTLRCSRDLKQVLRHHCDGSEVVETACAAGLGCGDGKCVEACTSAELSKGSYGCSFATLPPDESSGAQGSCFAAMIANTWDQPVTVTAMLGADPLDVGPSTYYAETKGTTVEYTLVGGPIAPGKVALVFLSGADTAPASPYDFTACPKTVVPAVHADPIAHKTARTHAFRLTTSAPVSAYSIWPYGGALSHTPTATVLLPVSSWDKNYVAVSAWATNIGAPTIQIVAAEDNTTVKMRPNTDILGGGGVAGIGEGQTQSWTLARGEVVQITQRGDTSGSPIEADKPIGLFGGSECTNLPSTTSACDVTQQQMVPVSQWGSEYALVPYRPRTGAGVGTTSARETVPWRLVGAVNGTKLVYDPAPPGGAPETLEAGQVVTFVTTEIVTVRAQDAVHPFYAGMFMTGGYSIYAATGGPAQGDPDFVNVVPSDQFLDHYIFFVDHTYPESTLTVVRRKTPTGFQPVTLDCAGEITDWKPLGNGGDYEFAWVYLTKLAVPQTFPAGTCGYGRHEAQSEGSFSVYVWGTDQYASYGYAGGMGSRPLSDVKGPPVN